MAPIVPKRAPVVRHRRPPEAAPEHRRVGLREELPKSSPGPPTREAPEVERVTAALRGVRRQHAPISIGKPPETCQLVRAVFGAPDER
jgi:hypothetical protein